MEFNDLILYLRNQTEQAYKTNDEQALERLFTTLHVIADGIEASGDWVYWQVVDDLIDSIRHIGLADFKVRIPDADEIRKLR